MVNGIVVNCLIMRVYKWLSLVDNKFATAEAPPVLLSSGKVDARVQDESALHQVRVQHVRGGRFWRKQSQLIASACRDGRSVDLISPPVAAL